MSTCPCCNMTWFFSAWFLQDCCARSLALLLNELIADEYLLEKLWAGDFEGGDFVDDRPKVFDNLRILLMIGRSCTLFILVEIRTGVPKLNQQLPLQNDATFIALNIATYTYVNYGILLSLITNGMPEPKK